ncbi:MAG: 2-amino-4-hydroxy-6-hydroxymethyldihydropteridine diphosphokinase [Cryomorphaceae bacterium]|nr:2-amino-4-hydroxy-6-hydroxymethyldihydropteridine diphosphokinase [Cryomorphaceae bacterium]
MQTIQKGEPIILLTGSNLGESLEILAHAKEKLDAIFNTSCLASAVFASPPWGFEAKNDFYNQALVYDNHSTSLSPLALMDEILSIEASCGRLRNNSKNYQSRTLDIDIIVIGKRIINHPTLTVPHPRLQERRFVLEPICDVVPKMVHPTTGLTFIELLEKCTDDSVVKKLDRQPL